nr:MAG TPA: hypothetical protein [Caudoviricetes sp.]DAH02526.1 MAG TPA: hypothetical protein [Caudoviricetes sp.]DAS87342.1 MAG TPA: hypothetical protein [Caudoviricetes sp.]
MERHTGVHGSCAGVRFPGLPPILIIKISEI